MSRWAGGVVWGLAAGLLLAYLLSLAAGGSFNIQTNILRLLPAERGDPTAGLAFERFAERNMRQLVFLVEDGGREAARGAADQLARSLRQSPHISEVVLRIEADEQQAAAAYAHAFRHRLLNASDAARLAAGDYAAFAEYALAQAFSPFSGGLSALLQSDPFLLSWRFVMANSGTGFPAFSLDEGYLLGEKDGRTLVLLRATLREGAFDPATQDGVSTLIAALEQAWREEDRDTRLLRAGAMFHADFAFDSARREVSLIGGSSLLLIVALVSLAFLSLRPILLVALSLGFGIACGFALVRLVFGEVHVLTLVFGASLTGVAVDYAFHYFAVDTGSAGAARLRAIFPAITLGLVSSMIGYAALASTPFPGLRQMALFCIAGLAGAWVTVVLVFPLVRLDPRPPAPLLAACRWFGGLGGRPAALSLFRLALCLPLAALVLLAASGRSADDIRQFQASDPALLAQEAEIGRLLQAPAPNQFYLVSGASTEALLENLEIAGTALDGLREQGAIDGYLSLSAWLPSQRRQAQNLALYRGLYQSEALASLREAGLLGEEEIAAARAQFARDRENVLEPEDFLQSPLGRQYGHLWLGRIEDRHAAVIALRGIRDLSALAGINGDIRLVDKVATVNGMINAYRDNVGYLLLLAALGILALLSLRYGARRAALILASPLIALSAAFLGLRLLGETLNLFNTLALILVLGVAVDFGIFLGEAGRLRTHTLLAVALSASTTLFSFGLLSLSRTPVIHAFGLTMLLGIGSAFLLAPVIGHLLRANPKFPSATTQASP